MLSICSGAGDAVFEVATSSVYAGLGLGHSIESSIAGSRAGGGSCRDVLNIWSREILPPVLTHHHHRHCCHCVTTAVTYWHGAYFTYLWKPGWKKEYIYVLLSVFS